jgi:hypothetical protein
MHRRPVQRHPSSIQTDDARSPIFRQTAGSIIRALPSKTHPASVNEKRAPEGARFNTTF